METGYAYNAANFTLERYYEEPTDYNLNTLPNKEVCLDGLSGCSFSYSDGKTWQASWSESKAELPLAMKLSFRRTSEEQERELVVNIPIGP